MPRRDLTPSLREDGRRGRAAARSPTLPPSGEVPRRGTRLGGREGGGERGGMGRGEEGGRIEKGG